MKEKAAGISLYECGSFLTDAENTCFWKKAVLGGFQGLTGPRGPGSGPGVWGGFSGGPGELFRGLFWGVFGRGFRGVFLRFSGVRKKRSEIAFSRDQLFVTISSRFCRP
jgi:hypothetical protein